MIVVYVMAFVIVFSVLLIILYYARNNRDNLNKKQARHWNTVDETPHVPGVKISNIGAEKDDFKISPEIPQVNKDLDPIHEPGEPIRPEIAKKNKWLNPDELGKMERGVVGDDESKEESKKKKKVMFLDDDIV